MLCICILKYSKPVPHNNSSIFSKISLVCIYVNKIICILKNPQALINMIHCNAWNYSINKTTLREHYKPRPKPLGRVLFHTTAEAHPSRSLHIQIKNIVYLKVGQMKMKFGMQKLYIFPNFTHFIWLKNKRIMAENS